MMRFSSPGDFATYLTRIADTLETAAEKSVDRVGMAVRDEAKNMLGTYQGGTNGIVGWTQLKESTQTARSAKGLTPNNPLLASGTLRDSIGYGVHGLKAVVGSPMQVAVYTEQGTAKMPPRPVFGLVGARMSPYVASILSEAIVSHISGTSVGNHL